MYTMCIMYIYDVYNIYDNDERNPVIRQKLQCILYSSQPLSLDVQPDDGLLEAETCSC